MAAWGKRLGFALGVGGAAVGTGWVADGLAGVFGALSEWPTDTSNPLLQIAGWVRGICWTSETTGQALWLLIGMAVLLGSLLLLFRLRHGIIIPRARMLRQDRFFGHHTLIMGLSARNEDQIKVTDHLSAVRFADVALPTKEMKDLLAKAADPSAPPEERERATQLEAFLPLVPQADGSPPKRQSHPWQQNLRMIWHHVQRTPQEVGQTLERVIVLPSRGSRPEAKEETAAGSWKDAQTFKRLLEEKLTEIGSTATVELSESGVDYLNLEETADVLSTLVQNAQQRRGGRHRRRASRFGSGICVDVTAGLKPFSIAAALVTMNEDLIFGYVDNDGQAKFYDARVEVAASFGE